MLPDAVHTRHTNKAKAQVMLPDAVHTRHTNKAKAQVMLPVCSAHKTH